VQVKSDKVILSNLSALKAKYGTAGVRAVTLAVRRLIEADRDRGLTTLFIPIDDAGAMRKYSARPVTQASNARQNKAAVDALYAALAPDYILLLGSSDVIPQQQLKNPVYTTPRGDDTDRYAPSDLPYACEAGYGQIIASFMGPTRVVGRLPDVAGANEPSYLLSIIKSAAESRPRNREDYQGHFVVSAQVWEDSTRQSMRALFGNSDGVLPVPPRSSAWAPALVKQRVHFINCHGASHASEFFGQPKSGKEQYPIALKASYIAGKIALGTIAAAECCYGGQLERVSPSHPRVGICETYLDGGAWAFVGSTTIAYGDVERNGDADLICQYFIENVLAGASLGRAFLQARQKFVRAASPLHPLDLKTLAQFNLYGDPSLVAVKTTFGAAVMPPVMGTMTARAERSARHDRRRELFQQGVSLSVHQPVVRKVATTKAVSIRRLLYARAKEYRWAPTALHSFSIGYRRGRATMPRALAESSAVPSAYHLLFCKPRGGRQRDKASSELGIPNIVALIGKEVNGTLVSYTSLRSR